MNCELIQSQLLEAEAPMALLQNDVALAGHVRACPQCGPFLEQLLKIESLAGDLPAPPGSLMAKQATLNAYYARERGVASRRVVVRRGWLTAAAAVLLVGAGVGAWVFNSTPRPVETQTVVVDQLIALDVALAQAQRPADREMLYSAQAKSLENALKDGRLNADDQQFASSLLQHSQWLSKNADPVDEAERFTDLADLVATRINNAAMANDPKALKRSLKHYDQLMNGGVESSLSRAQSTAFIDPDRDGRLELLVKRNEMREQRLAALAERSSAAARKELNRSLNAAKNRGQDNVKKNKPATTRPVTTRPATTRPATTRPATMRPATTRPVAPRPATTFPADAV